MEELARTKLEEEREGVVALLRTIADRLHSLPLFEARRSLARLASPVALLAHEAEPMIGPLPAVEYTDTDPDPPPRPTVVFVRRGAALGA
jgi:hypothetical protein